MRLLLADDHDLVRDAIASLLSSEDKNVEVISAKDLNEALKISHQEENFDVVILDLRMPGMNGLVGAQKMIEQVGNTPVVLMSGSASTADVRAAHKMGVKGFVPKTLAGKSLINAIRLVASGDAYFPVEMLSPQSCEKDQGIKLTNRETEVLAQLRHGNANKEIARTLNIAETTVKLHLRSLSEKLNARNRTEILINAIDEGLV